MTATLIPNADDLRIAEQMALAKTLREKGMTGTGGSGMAGNVYMVGNQWGNLAQSLGGAAMQYMGDRNRQELEGTRNQQYEEYMRQMPSATMPQTTLGTDPGSEQSRMLAEQEGVAALPETSVLKSARQQQQEMNRFALNAPNIPQFQALRQAGMLQSLSAPEKQAAAEEAATAREHQLKMTLMDRQAQREWQAAHDDKFKRTFEQMMALKTAPTIHINNGGGGASKPDMRIVDTVDDNGNPVKKVIDLNQMKPGEVMGKPADAATRKAVIEANVGIGNIDRAIELIDAKPSALGPQYKIPGAEIAGQYLDPEGVPARAAVSNVGSLKLHDRSGAAVTISEFPRLAPFIPTAGDSPKAAKDKLNGLKAEYELIKQEWAAGTNGSLLGGKPKAKSDKAPPAAAAPKANTTAPGTKGTHKSRPVVMGTDGEWHYEN